MDILICFALVAHDLFYQAELHFPFMVLLALTSLLVCEIFVPGNPVKRKAPDMLQKSFATVREQLTDLSVTKNNMTWFYYLERLLMSAKGQFKPEMFDFYINNTRTLRVISAKLNYITQHIKSSENVVVDFLPELKNITRLMDIALKAASEKNKANFAHLNDAVDTLQMHFSKSDDRNDQNFLLLILEIKYIIEEMQKLNITTSPVMIEPEKNTKKINKVALKFSLQVTVTVALTISAILYFNIPGGYQTLLAGIFIAATPHTGALILKFFMRMAGILLGGLSALLIGLLLMKVNNIFVTLIALGIFVYISAWWAMRYEKFTYAGIQAGLMFVMLLFADGGHYLAISVGIQRFEGVIIGSLIALVINLILGPELPSRYIKSIILNILQDIETYLHLIANGNPENQPQEEQLLQKIFSKIDEVESTALLQYLNPKKRKTTLAITQNLRATYDQLKRLLHVINSTEKVNLPDVLNKMLQAPIASEKNCIEITNAIANEIDCSHDIRLLNVKNCLSTIFENLAGLNKMICNTKCK